MRRFGQSKFFKNITVTLLNAYNNIAH